MTGRRDDGRDLVRGGQGRSARELEESASWLWTLAAMAVGALGAYFLAAAFWGASEALR